MIKNIYAALSAVAREPVDADPLDARRAARNCRPADSAHGSPRSLAPHNMIAAAARRLMQRA